MKPVKILLISAAFIAMIAAMFNYYTIISHTNGKLGVYLEIATIAFITIAVGLLGYNDKRKR